jgi:hypothetical protein
MADLSKFKSVTPYASELAGVFQPLLGWRSAQSGRRVTKSIKASFRLTVQDLARDSRLQDNLDGIPWQLDNLAPRPLINDSPILGRIARAIQEQVGNRRELSADDWRGLLTDDLIHQELLESVQSLSTPPVDAMGRERETFVELHEEGSESRRRVFATAATLQHLATTDPEVLNDIFLKREMPWEQTINYINPFHGFSALAREAVLAPVGLLHVYRQYFFEFDSFLGPPVGHVWLSSHGTVELVESNVRRTLTERTLEVHQESTAKTELSATSEDELSEAVKQDTADDIKLGVNVSAGFKTPVYHGEASSSFSFNTSRKNSAETTHRRKRSQSEKLSSEIRRSYKTTFRTVSEITDTSSRRYVLSNDTDLLVNYELRRKMRRVGVQLQHIATQLCWQFYIDDPGRSLGTSQLVHVASTADAKPSTPPPNQPADIAPKDLPFTVQFQFIDLRLATEDADQTFDGGWHKPDAGKDSHIQNVQTFTFPPPAGYELDNVQILGFTRADPDKDLPDPFVPHPSVNDRATGKFTIDVSSVNFQDQPYIPINLNLRFVGTAAAKKKQEDDYKTDKAAYDAAAQRTQHEAYINAVRDRIKLAGKVLTRSEDVLREEERTIVYQQMVSRLTNSPPSANPHVTSELIRRLFDVDAMLYFVAPDWWTARNWVSQQFTVSSSGTESDPYTIGNDDLIGWGGVNDLMRPQYMVTEDSRPAPMGASLGWLLQLDGDPRRNAFLNASWVKAVLPIRPGRELEAIAWLENAHVEGSDGLSDSYILQKDDPPEFANKSVRQVLELLAEQIAELQVQARTVDPTSDAFPGELVFEKGFDPLAGGTRLDAEPFDVFDQWLEVLPTDQVVAVEYIPVP